MEEEIFAILSSAKFPLHAREVRQVLVRNGTSIPEYALIGKLRSLMTEGRAEFTRGKWRAIGQHCAVGNHYGSPDIFQTFPDKPAEPYGITADKTISEPAFPTPRLRQQETAAGAASTTPTGPWGAFRALLNYYRDCIRNEGGSEAMARLDDLNSKFMYVSRPGMWLPRPGYSWNLSIPLGSHLGSFIQQLASLGQDTVIVLGYPLQVVQFKREGEPDSYLLKPIFHFTLEHNLQNGSLLLYTDDPRVQVNLEWIGHTFRNSDQQRSFLSACGFIGSDSDSETFPYHTCPKTEHLAATLAAFMPKSLHEPLVPNLIPKEPLRAPLKTGVYNRAVIMLARRPQYTKSLLRDLSRIQDTSDDELDKTALRYIFRSPQVPETEGFDAEPASPTVADTTPLNSEQRKAVASLLNLPITVITGPPGTGKSQVVSTAVANAYLFSQSVLFTSRNHKAIDAVYERCRDQIGRPLLVRCNNRDDPNLRVTFPKAIAILLGGEANIPAGEEAIDMSRNLQLLLNEREERLQQSEKILSCQERLGIMEEESTTLSLRMPDVLTSRLSSNAGRFPAKHLDKINSLADSLHSSGNGRKSRLGALFSAISSSFSWKALRSGLKPIGVLPLPIGYVCTPSRLSVFLKDRKLLEDAAAFCACRTKILSLEEEIKALPDVDILTSAVAELTERIRALAPRILERLVSAHSGLLPGEDRESLANLRSALQYIDTGTAPVALQNSTNVVLEAQLSRLLEFMPCWAVTSLSVGSRIPFYPGMFDLAVIDEASQSDIPSAIPVLFRAKRAGVVGDPRQLTHVTNLSLAKDSMLRRRTGLDRVADQRFSYIETSLYSLFADTNGISPIFLCETYRSTEEIARYANDLFYGGRLKVATDTSKFPPLPNMRLGIHWSDVGGVVQSGGVGGSCCREEVEAIATLAREIILENRFRGTLGIVTPFREQANRIKDSIFEGDIPWELLQAAEVVVDTSHGFQGDERDVILFSLCAGPGMPAGSLRFLRETGNLFNVAVSRARAVLHVVGNRNWASNCGIRHVERLAKPVMVAQQEPLAGPWAPHESPWEKYLFEALTAAGLSPIPQYPVGYRRLDLALIRKDPRQLKIDIEVDGACCHRNPDGTRKLEDIWRDIQLQGMGWRVVRFWVYQLRESMEDCVKRILEVWNSHE